MKYEKSSFPYWFAHWCAFQMTAINLGCWKPRFLLHDIIKPWLRLFMPYERVRAIHRRYSHHHLSYMEHKRLIKMDWLSVVIDWECSRYTKPDSPFTARQMMLDVKYQQYAKYINPILDELGL